MADKKIRVQLDVDTNIEPTIANLKALKRQLRETAAGSAEFNKISQQIRDMDDAIKDANATSDDFLGYLENASGPLGMLGKGIRGAEKNFSSFNAVLKASVIGLIVTAIGGLVAAFRDNEVAMKKIQPVMIQVEKLLGGIFRAVEPLFNGLIDIATKALPVVTDGFKIFYSILTAVFQSLGKVGTAVVKLIKGDFSGAFKDAKGAVTEFSDNYTAATKRFEAGAKEVTKTEKEELEKQKKAREEAEKARREAAEKALQERLKRMETEDKLDEARLEKLKQEALAVAETEQQKFDVEKSFAEKLYQLRLKDLTDKQALYRTDSNEFKDLQTQKIKLESDFIAQTEGFATKQKEISDKTNKDLLASETAALTLRRAKGEIEESDYQTALFELKKKYLTDSKELIDAEIAYETYRTAEKKKDAEEQRNILLSDLQTKFEVLDAENERIDGDFVADLQRFAQQRQILAEQEAIELQNEELTEFQKTEIRKKYADARKQISDNEVATEKAAMEARHEINMAYLGLFEQFGSVLGQLAGKNKALAIAGVVIQQAAAIGQIISQTAIANAKAVAISPLTGGLPWVAINKVSAALSIASTIAAGVKAVQQINQAASQSGISGGGAGASTGTVGVAPAAPTLPTTSAPQIQPTGGTNPNQQIATTIASATSRPIRAYVVSGEVSTQQALDRRTSRAATFTAG